MKKKAHIRFTGMVQGVGFRYTARHVAHTLGLVGWVKNMVDGSVEAVAEGEEEKAKQFVNSLNERFKDYITDTDASWSDPTDEFNVFDVRF